MSMGMSGAAAAPAKEVPSWRLLAMMTGCGAVAGLLIVVAFQVTLPRIEQHKGEVERATVYEVLRAPASFDTLYLHGGRLVPALPPGTSPKGLEKIFLGRDAAGRRVGFALSATGNGFQDPVTVMFGYDAAARSVIAMRVIASRETPGLGDKIVKDTSFVGGFVGTPAPLRGVGKDRGKGAPNDVVMITGATISSRAVIRIINDAVARWQPLMDAYREGATP
jgi:Na+-translocating ferredoxin:NAD+ oxidoreductase subunit G